MINEYWESYLEALSGDVEEMLKEEDRKNRLTIMKYLELMDKCRERLDEKTPDWKKEWDKLSKGAQTEILAIIQKDIHNDKSSGQD